MASQPDVGSAGNPAAVCPVSGRAFPFKIGDLVVSEWEDGKFYYSKLLEVDHELQTCRLIFDDNIMHELPFSKVHSVTEETSEIVCIICKEGDSEPPNEIVICDICSYGFHQDCHSPEIPNSVLEDEEVPWVCTYCDHGTDCPFLLNPFLEDSAMGSSRNDDDDWSETLYDRVKGNQRTARHARLRYREFGITAGGNLTFLESSFSSQENGTGMAFSTSKNASISVGLLPSATDSPKQTDPQDLPQAKNNPWLAPKMWSQSLWHSQVGPSVKSTVAHDSSAKIDETEQSLASEKPVKDLPVSFYGKSPEAVTCNFQGAKVVLSSSGTLTVEKTLRSLFRKTPMMVLKKLTLSRKRLKLKKGFAVRTRQSNDRPKPKATSCSSSQVSEKYMFKDNTLKSRQFSCPLCTSSTNMSDEERIKEKILYCGKHELSAQEQRLDQYSKSKYSLSHHGNHSSKHKDTHSHVDSVLDRFRDHSESSGKSCVPLGHSYTSSKHDLSMVDDKVKGMSSLLTMKINVRTGTVETISKPRSNYRSHESLKLKLGSKSSRKRHHSHHCNKNSGSSHGSHETGSKSVKHRSHSVPERSQELKVNKTPGTYSKYGLSSSQINRLQKNLPTSRSPTGDHLKPDGKALLKVSFRKFPASKKNYSQTEAQTVSQFEIDPSSEISLNNTLAVKLGITQQSHLRAQKHIKDKQHISSHDEKRGNSPSPSEISKLNCSQTKESANKVNYTPPVELASNKAFSWMKKKCLEEQSGKVVTSVPKETDKCQNEQSGISKLGNYASSSVDKTGQSTSHVRHDNGGNHPKSSGKRGPKVAIRGVTSTSSSSQNAAQLAKSTDSPRNLDGNVAKKSRVKAASEKCSISESIVSPSSPSKRKTVSTVPQVEPILSCVVSLPNASRVEPILSSVGGKLHRKEFSLHSKVNSIGPIKQDSKSDEARQVKNLAVVSSLTNLKKIVDLTPYRKKSTEEKPLELVGDDSKTVQHPVTDSSISDESNISHEVTPDVTARESTSSSSTHTEPSPDKFDQERLDDSVSEIPHVASGVPQIPTIKITPPDQKTNSKTPKPECDTSKSEVSYLKSETCPSSSSSPVLKECPDDTHKSTTGVSYPPSGTSCAASDLMSVTSQVDTSEVTHGDQTHFTDNIPSLSRTDNTSVLESCDGVTDKNAQKQESTSACCLETSIALVCPKSPQNAQPHSTCPCDSHLCQEECICHKKQATNDKHSCLSERLECPNTYELENAIEPGRTKSASPTLDADVKLQSDSSPFTFGELNGVSEGSHSPICPHNPDLSPCGDDTENCVHVGNEKVDKGKDVGTILSDRVGDENDACSSRKARDEKQLGESDNDIDLDVKTSSFSYNNVDIPSQAQLSNLAQKTAVVNSSCNVPLPSVEETYMNLTNAVPLDKLHGKKTILTGDDGNNTLTQADVDSRSIQHEYDSNVVVEETVLPDHDSSSYKYSRVTLTKCDNEISLQDKFATDIKDDITNIEECKSANSSQQTEVKSTSALCQTETKVSSILPSSISLPKYDRIQSEQISHLPPVFKQNSTISPPKSEVQLSPSSADSYHEHSLKEDDSHVTPQSDCVSSGNLDNGKIPISCVDGEQNPVCANMKECADAKSINALQSDHNILDAACTSESQFTCSDMVEPTDELAVYKLLDSSEIEHSWNETVAMEVTIATTTFSEVDSPTQSGENLDSEEIKTQCNGDVMRTDSILDGDEEHQGEESNVLVDQEQLENAVRSILPASPKPTVCPSFTKTTFKSNAPSPLALSPTATVVPTVTPSKKHGSSQEQKTVSQLHVHDIPPVIFTPPSVSHDILEETNLAVQDLVTQLEQMDHLVSQVELAVNETCAASQEEFSALPELQTAKDTRHEVFNLAMSGDHSPSDVKAHTNIQGKSEAPFLQDKEIDISSHPIYGMGYIDKEAHVALEALLESVQASTEDGLGATVCSERESTSQCAEMMKKNEKCNSLSGQMSMRDNSSDKLNQNTNDSLHQLVESEQPNTHEFAKTSSADITSVIMAQVEDVSKCCQVAASLNLSSAATLSEAKSKVGLAMKQGECFVEQADVHDDEKTQLSLRETIPIENVETTGEDSHDMEHAVVEAGVIVASEMVAQDTLNEETQTVVEDILKNIIDQVEGSTSFLGLIIDNVVSVKEEVFNRLGWSPTQKGNHDKNTKSDCHDVHRFETHELGVTNEAVDEVHHLSNASMPEIPSERPVASLNEELLVDQFAEHDALCAGNSGPVVYTDYAEMDGNDGFGPLVIVTEESDVQGEATAKEGVIQQSQKSTYDNSGPASPQLGGVDSIQMQVEVNAAGTECVPISSDTTHIIASHFIDEMYDINAGDSRVDQKNVMPFREVSAEAKDPLPFPVLLISKPKSNLEPSTISSQGLAPYPGLPEGFAVTQFSSKHSKALASRKDVINKCASKTLGTVLNNINKDERQRKPPTKRKKGRRRRQIKKPLKIKQTSYKKTTVGRQKKPLAINTPVKVFNTRSRTKAKERLIKPMLKKDNVAATEGYNNEQSVEPDIYNFSEDNSCMKLPKSVCQEPVHGRKYAGSSQNKLDRFNNLSDDGTDSGTTATVDPGTSTVSSESKPRKKQRIWKRKKVLKNDSDPFLATENLDIDSLIGVEKKGKRRRKKKSLDGEVMTPLTDPSLEPMEEPELPTILPPKRRRQRQHQGKAAAMTTSPSSGTMLSSDRIAIEFTRHNWLENKIKRLNSTGGVEGNIEDGENMVPASADEGDCFSERAQKTNTTGVEKAKKSPRRSRSCSSEGMKITYHDNICLSDSTQAMEHNCASDLDVKEGSTRTLDITDEGVATSEHPCETGSPLNLCTKPESEEYDNLHEEDGRLAAVEGMISPSSTRGLFGPKVKKDAPILKVQPQIQQPFAMTAPELGPPNQLVQQTKEAIQHVSLAWPISVPEPLNVSPGNLGSRPESSSVGMNLTKDSCMAVKPAVIVVSPQESLDPQITGQFIVAPTSVMEGSSSMIPKVITTLPKALPVQTPTSVTVGPGVAPQGSNQAMMALNITPDRVNAPVPGRYQSSGSQPIGAPQHTSPDLGKHPSALPLDNIQGMRTPPNQMVGFKRQGSHDEPPVKTARMSGNGGSNMGWQVGNGGQQLFGSPSEHSSHAGSQQPQQMSNSGHHLAHVSTSPLRQISPNASISPRRGSGQNQFKDPNVNNDDLEMQFELCKQQFQKIQELAKQKEREQEELNHKRKQMADILNHMEMIRQRTRQRQQRGIGDGQSLGIAKGGPNFSISPYPPVSPRMGLGASSPMATVPEVTATATSPSTMLPGIPSPTRMSSMPPPASPPLRMPLHPSASVPQQGHYPNMGQQMSPGVAALRQRMFAPVTPRPQAVIGHLPQQSPPASSTFATQEAMNRRGIQQFNLLGSERTLPTTKIAASYPSSMPGQLGPVAVRPRPPYPYSSPNQYSQNTYGYSQANMGLTHTGSPGLPPNTGQRTEPLVMRANDVKQSPPRGLTQYPAISQGPVSRYQEYQRFTSSGSSNTVVPQAINQTSQILPVGRQTRSASDSAIPIQAGMVDRQPSIPQEQDKGESTGPPPAHSHSQNSNNKMAAPPPAHTKPSISLERRHSAESLMPPAKKPSVMTTPFAPRKEINTPPDMKPLTQQYMPPPAHSKHPSTYYSPKDQAAKETSRPSCKELSGEQNIPDVSSNASPQQSLSGTSSMNLANDTDGTRMSVKQPTSELNCSVPRPKNTNLPPPPPLLSALPAQPQISNDSGPKPVVMEPLIVQPQVDISQSLSDICQKQTGTNRQSAVASTSSFTENHLSHKSGMTTAAEEGRYKVSSETEPKRDNGDSLASQDCRTNTSTGEANGNGLMQAPKPVLFSEVTALMDMGKQLNTESLLHSGNDSDILTPFDTSGPRVIRKIPSDPLNPPISQESVSIFGSPNSSPSDSQLLKSSTEDSNVTMSSASKIAETDSNVNMTPSSLSVPDMHTTSTAEREPKISSPSGISPGMLVTGSPNSTRCETNSVTGSGTSSTHFSQVSPSQESDKSLSNAEPCSDISSTSARGQASDDGQSSEKTAQADVTSEGKPLSSLHEMLHDTLTRSAIAEGQEDVENKAASSPVNLEEMQSIQDITTTLDSGEQIPLKDGDHNDSITANETEDSNFTEDSMKMIDEILPGTENNPDKIIQSSLLNGEKDKLSNNPMEGILQTFDGVRNTHTFMSPESFTDLTSMTENNDKEDTVMNLEVKTVVDDILTRLDTLPTEDSVDHEVHCEESGVNVISGLMEKSEDMFNKYTVNSQGVVDASPNPVVIEPVDNRNDNNISSGTAILDIGADKTVQRGGASNIGDDSIPSNNWLVTRQSSLDELRKDGSVNAVPSEEVMRTAMSGKSTELTTAAVNPMMQECSTPQSVGISCAPDIDLISLAKKTLFSTPGTSEGTTSNIPSNAVSIPTSNPTVCITTLNEKPALQVESSESSQFRPGNNTTQANSQRETVVSSNKKLGLLHNSEVVDLTRADTPEMKLAMGRPRGRGVKRPYGSRLSFARTGLSLEAVRSTIAQAGSDPHESLVQEQMRNILQSRRVQRTFVGVRPRFPGPPPNITFPPVRTTYPGVSGQPPQNSGPTGNFSSPSTMDGMCYPQTAPASRDEQMQRRYRAVTGLVPPNPEMQQSVSTSQEQYSCQYGGLSRTSTNTGSIFSYNTNMQQQQQQQPPTQRLSHPPRQMPNQSPAGVGVPHHSPDYGGQFPSSVGPMSINTGQKISPTGMPNMLSPQNAPPPLLSPQIPPSQANLGVSYTGRSMPHSSIGGQGQVNNNYMLSVQQVDPAQHSPQQQPQQQHYRQDVLRQGGAPSQNIGYPVESHRLRDHVNQPHMNQSHTSQLSHPMFPPQVHEPPSRTDMNQSYMQPQQQHPQQHPQQQPYHSINTGHLNPDQGYMGVPQHQPTQPGRQASFTQPQITPGSASGNAATLRHLGQGSSVSMSAGGTMMPHSMTATPSNCGPRLAQMVPVRPPPYPSRNVEHMTVQPMGGHTAYGKPEGIHPNYTVMRNAAPAPMQPRNLVQTMIQRGQPPAPQYQAVAAAQPLVPGSVAYPHTTHVGTTTSSASPVILPAGNIDNNVALVVHAVPGGIVKNCQVCQKEATFLCSGCKNVWYCSPQCQTQSWETHSLVCG